MRKLLIIFLLLICFSVSGQLIPGVVASSYQVAAGTEIRVAQYKFEQNANDTYGANEGSVTGTIVYQDMTSYGLDGYAYNGGSTGFETNRITIPEIDYGSTFSISFWLWTDGVLDQDYPFFQTASNGFILYGNLYSGGTLKFRTSNGTDIVTATSSVVSYTLETVANIVVTVNRTAGTCKIYFNGTDVTSSGSTRTDFDNTVTLCPFEEYPYLEITNSGFWVGWCDELQIYNVELTQSEVTWIQTHQGTMVTR